MSIAEKLLRAKEDLDAVYQAGLLDDTYYLPGTLDFRQLFYKTEFPVGYSLTIKTGVAPGSLGEIFRMAVNIERVKLDIPAATHNATYFAYSAKDLKEVEFPDGIKLTNFTNGFSMCSALVTIKGAIDLSGATGVDGCFTGCGSLVDVRFVPGTINLSISFNASSGLSDASIQSIVDGLASLPAGSGQTLTVHKTVAANMTEAQKTAITTKNWTLVS